MDSDNSIDFNTGYECSALPAVKAVERGVLGCDYGGTSWTTREQANYLMSSLGLATDSQLLEVGSGAGWPGLYISTESGCNVTLLDMPLIALEQAKERAERDDIIERVNIINGNGTSLPFADASFDRLSHSDVLCCLPEKLEMLEECRRVAAADAQMIFLVIEPATGLSTADYKRGIDAAPPFAEVPEGYPELLQKSGWQLLERIDVTEEFAKTLQKEIDGLKDNTAALQEAYGADELCEMLEQSEIAIETVKANMLQRFIYVAEC